MGLASKHFTLAALASLTALVTHQAAYLLAHLALRSPVNRLSDHSHLGIEWALVAPLATLAAGAFVLRQVRRFHGVGGKAAGGLDHRWITLVGAAFFIAQETTEAVTHSGNLAALAAEPALYTGILLAPVAALIIARIVDHATDLAAKFFRVGSRTIPPRRVLSRPSCDVAARQALIASSSARGPPPLFRL